MPLNLSVPAEDLFGHMAWADALVARAVLSSPDATADQKTCELLKHYNVTQRAFLALWRQAPLDEFRNLANEPTDVASTLAAMQRYYAELSRWMATVGEGQQHEALVVPWAGLLEQKLGCKPEPVTIGVSMVQVAMHSAHHRAQVSLRLRQLGSEPPLVDFIAWAWMGRPSPEWPEASAAR